MTVDAEKTHLCHYRLLHNRIHCFTLNKANRDGVETFLALFSDVLASTNPDECLLLMLDLRPDGLPPIADAFTALRKTFGPYAHSHRKMRVALLYQSDAILTVLKIFLNALRRDVARGFFTGGQEETAAAWLVDSSLVG